MEETIVKIRSNLEDLLFFDPKAEKLYKKAEVFCDYPSGPKKAEVLLKSIRWIIDYRKIHGVDTEGWA